MRNPLNDSGRRALCKAIEVVIRPLFCQRKNGMARHRVQARRKSHLRRRRGFMEIPSNAVMISYGTMKRKKGQGETKITVWRGRCRWKEGKKHSGGTEKNLDGAGRNIFVFRLRYKA